MSDMTSTESRLRDALSDVTRKQRRLLLGVSLLGIALVKTGFVPSRISGLGIEFKGADQLSIIWIVLFVTLYFLISFLIYAVADFLPWWIALMKTSISNDVAAFEDSIYTYIPADNHDPVVDSYRQRLHQKRLKIPFRIVKPTSVCRALFDFLLPILVGLYAIITLIGYHIQKA